jgi:aryl-alcohol dehydrogenase
VGLSALLAAVQITGATTAVVDVNPARLELAPRLNAGEQDAAEALTEFSGGRGIHRTLEATGVPAVLKQAIEALAPRGVCGIVGAPAPDAEVSMNILTAIVKGSSVVGITQGAPVPREAIPPLVELHRQGRFPFDELIRVYPFEDIQQAAADAAARTVVKPVLRIPA